MLLYIISIGNLKRKILRGQVLCHILIHTLISLFKLSVKLIPIKLIFMQFPHDSARHKYLSKILSCSQRKMLGSI